MAEDKYLGLDGFLLPFFMRYQPIIQVEVEGAVMEFFTMGEMLSDWIRTFITLVC